MINKNIVSMLLVVCQLFLPLLASAQSSPFSDARPVAIEQVGVDTPSASESVEPKSHDIPDLVEYDREARPFYFGTGFLGMTGLAIGAIVGAAFLTGGVGVLGVAAIVGVSTLLGGAVGYSQDVASANTEHEGEVRKHQAIARWVQSAPLPFEPPELQQATLNLKRAAVIYRNASLAGNIRTRERKALQKQVIEAQKAYDKVRQEFLNTPNIAEILDPNKDPRVVDAYKEYQKAKRGNDAEHTLQLKTKFETIRESVTRQYENYRKYPPHPRSLHVLGIRGTM